MILLNKSHTDPCIKSKKLSNSGCIWVLLGLDESFGYLNKNRPINVPEQFDQFQVSSRSASRTQP